MIVMSIDSCYKLHSDLWLLANGRFNSTLKLATTKMPNSSIWGKTRFFPFRWNHEHILVYYIQTDHK